MFLICCLFLLFLPANIEKLLKMSETNKILTRRMHTCTLLVVRLALNIFKISELILNYTCSWVVTYTMSSYTLWYNSNKGEICGFPKVGNVCLNTICGFPKVGNICLNAICGIVKFTIQVTTFWVAFPKVRI